MAGYGFRAQDLGFRNYGLDPTVCQKELEGLCGANTWRFGVPVASRCCISGSAGPLNPTSYTLGPRP